jgi:hypothetical protein
LEYFQIQGNVSGANTVLQGIYANQSSVVMNRCLALAEQLDLNHSGKSPTLRIQLMPDPARKGFALIQYCTLYQ